MLQRIVDSRISDPLHLETASEFSRIPESSTSDPNFRTDLRAVERTTIYIPLKQFSTSLEPRTLSPKNK